MYRVDSNKNQGRFFLATEDLPMGRKILVESPAILGPVLGSQNGLCLGCHSPIVFVRDTCEKCSVPLCGEDTCRKSKWHSIECSTLVYMSNQWKERPTSFFKTFGGFITPLRFLLLQKSGVSFDLVSNVEEKMKDIQKKALLEENASRMMKHLENSPLSESLSPADLIVCFCILDSNAYQVLSPISHESLMALYRKASLINHSCDRNTRYVLSKWPDYQMTVISSKAIGKGQEITASYLGPFHTTMQRRRILKSGKSFDCSCPRCSDRTELGSFSSGVKCRYCPIGYFLPKDPLTDASEWMCSNCNHVIEHQTVTLMEESLVKELTRVNRSSVQNIEKFLKTYEALLHPRHAFILELRQFLVEGIGRLDDCTYARMTLDKFERKVVLCREQQEAFKYIETPLSFICGVVHLEEADALYRQYLISREEPLKETARSAIKKSLEVLKYEDQQSDSEGTCLRRAMEIYNVLFETH